MPAIGDLDRVGQSLCDRLAVAAATVACDDGDVRV